MQSVKLVNYDPAWKDWFEAESAKLQKLLGPNCCAIHHIGSTAIPGIYAKPVIDILPAVLDINKVDELNADFEKQGYTCLGEYGMPGRRFFKKTVGNQSYNVHVFQEDNSEVKRHIAFKDRLIQDKNEALAYSWIKRTLAEQFPYDRDAYTEGKDSFIRMIDYRAGVAEEDQLAAQDDVILKDPNPNWLKLGSAEIKAINKIISLPSHAIEHLGSTSIPGLTAKPIIDIFIALNSIEEAEQWIKPLESMGYDYWYENPDPMHQRFFKGMPPYGIGRTHHVHILPVGQDFDNRVFFKDQLRSDAALRKQYESLKLDLAQKHPGNREAYTDAKARFIKDVLSKES